MVVAIVIFSIFSTGVFYLSIDAMQSGEKIEEGNMALLYAQEGLEVARQMRDRNYFSLGNGDHGLQLAGDVWSFIPAPEDIDGFYSRTVSVEDVYRDVDGNIAEAGTLDPDTKKVISLVEWTYRGVLPRSIELESYLSNWTGDDWLQTDCDELNSGTFDDVTVEFTAAPPENNCALKLVLVEEVSEFLSSADVGEHGNDVWVEGNYAYIAVNKTNQGLAIVDITDRKNPSVIKQVDIGGKGLAVTKQGNYLYVGVYNSSKGLAVVDVSNPASAFLVTKKYVFGEGDAVAINGNYLYMGIRNYPILVVVNISTPTNPYVYSFYITTNNVYDIDIAGDYAYCGVDDDWLGFQIFDISAPASIFPISFLSVGEEVNAVALQGSYAFLGTEKYNDSFYVVDISDPDNPEVENHINIEGEIQDLVVEGDYVYAAVDETNEGLSAINISTPTSPYLVYTTDILGKATSVKSDGSYVYITIDVNNKGLIILGTTVVESVATGSYISQPYDTGSSNTRYNFIEWDSVAVPGGSAKLQIRTASTEAGLSSATWVGSDGTAATYYEASRTPIIVAPGASGTRFVQFKVYIDSDGAHTPLVESIRVNYTP